MESPEQEINQQIEQFHSKARALAEELQGWLAANGDRLNSKNKTMNRQWHHLYLAQETLFEAVDEISTAASLQR